MESMEEPIGMVEPVDPADIWGDSGRDLAIWLSKGPNLSRLSDCLGLQLAFDSASVPVGAYEADLVVRDEETDQTWIVQSATRGATCADLGTALVLTSALDAAGVIWVARSFDDALGRAVRWLNRRTGPELSFYGATMDLWRIDGSRPALRFVCSCKPEGEDVATPVMAAPRALHPLPAGGASQAEREAWLLDFWRAVRARLMETKVLSGAPEPVRADRYDLPLGHPEIFLSLVARAAQGTIGARVYIEATVAPETFPFLLAQREAVERDVGSTLAWDPTPENRDKMIALYRDAQLSEQGEWSREVDWLVDTVRRFRNVFVPRIKTLYRAAA